MGLLLRKFKDHSLFGGTVWMMLAHGGRLVIQTSYFIVLSRTLGAHSFGMIAGITAIAAILSPFSGWGVGSLLVKYVARQPELFRCFWAVSLKSVLSSGLLIATAGAVTARLYLGNQVSPIIVICIIVADLVFLKLSDVAGQAFQAVDKLKYTAGLQIFGYLMRLAAAVAFSALDNHTVEIWGWLYLGATVVSSGIAVAVTSIVLGKPDFRVSPPVRLLSEGFYFSLGLASRSVYADLDKTLLLRFTTQEVTGFYSAAYRIVSVALAPVQALLAASYGRFFRAGAYGTSHTLNMARRYIPVVVGYGTLAGVVIYIASPLVPWILGSDFAGSVPVLRWLSFLPLLQGLHFMAADALTGADYQKQRSLIQLSAGVVNAVLNLLWIPSYSWLGAVWATFASEALLAVTLWALLLRLSRQAVSGRGSSDGKFVFLKGERYAKVHTNSSSSLQ